MAGLIAGGPRDEQGAPVVAPSAYAYSAEAARFRGYLYAVPSSGTYSFDERLDQAVLLQGGLVWYTGATLGDKASLQVVDIDNVTGAGAGTVLATYVLDMHLAPFDSHVAVEAQTAASLAAGLYLRTTIEHTGAGGLAVGVTYKLYEVP